MAWQQFQQSIHSTFAMPITLLLGLSIAIVSPSAVLAQDTATTTYLYGTTSTPEQIGHDYMVIQLLEENQVQGAFYQINSEFACFSGEIAEGALKLAVVDPYEQVAYDYEMNYQSTLVADNGDRPTTEFIPAGFQAINSLGELDRAILEQCVTDVPLEV
ncbi:MAG: hypothetical protein HC799_18665 [Limnothrix sp. RL_2_0]|nr:hypothetical protein [Limnothrix sp. RL_2_0]